MALSNTVSSGVLGLMGIVVLAISFFDGGHFFDACNLVKFPPVFAVSTPTTALSTGECYSILQAGAASAAEHKLGTAKALVFTIGLIIRLQNAFAIAIATGSLYTLAVVPFEGRHPIHLVMLVMSILAGIIEFNHAYGDLPGMVSANRADPDQPLDEAAWALVAMWSVFACAHLLAFVGSRAAFAVTTKSKRA